MASPSVADLSKDMGIIAINPQKDRVRAILRGLAAHRNLDIRESVGLDWHSAPLTTLDIDSALNSAGRRPENAVLQAGKKLFLQWQYNWCFRLFSQSPPRVIACWNGLKGHRFLALTAARQCGHTPLYLEEAPLPGRISVDFSGINYGNSLPRCSGFYHAWLEQNPKVDALAWRQIKQDLIKENADRVDYGNYLFCPLQVPNDSQLTVYGDWVRTIDQMIDQLEIAASALPTGWHLRIKEHPKARELFTSRLSGLRHKGIVLDNQSDTMDLVAGARGVVTINSSVGFESFFFDKPVLALGQAFYAFDQLATRVRSAEELKGWFAAPEELTFDASARNAFMSYVTRQHFPTESDVVSGRFTLDDVVRRDSKRNDLLNFAGST